MPLPATTALALQVDDGVLHATLDRPDKGNALNTALLDDLIATFEGIRDDPAIRLVILRGAGRHFCVGADLNEMRAPEATDAPSRDEVVAHNRRFGAMLEAVDAAPQATVVLAHGAALGGGFGMLCVTDVTVVTADARMGVPEVRLGVPATQILPFVVARIGAAQTRRIAVCGHRFEGAEAARLGIAHHVVDDLAAGEDRVTEIAAAIRAGAPGAITTSKAVIRESARREPSGLLDDGAEWFPDDLAGEEGQEGVRAFFDKRAPFWAGP